MSCPGVCRPVLRVCLQPSSSRSGWEWCPLGSAQSNFLPLDLHPDEPFLRVPFNYSWPVCPLICIISSVCSLGQLLWLPFMVIDGG